MTSYVPQAVYVKAVTSKLLAKVRYILNVQHSPCEKDPVQSGSVTLSATVNSSFLDSKVSIYWDAFCDWKINGHPSKLISKALLIPTQHATYNVFERHLMKRMSGSCRNSHKVPKAADTMMFAVKISLITVISIRHVYTLRSAIIIKGHLTI